MNRRVSTSVITYAENAHAYEWWEITLEKGEVLAIGYRELRL